MAIERFYTPGLAQIAYGVADPVQKVAAIIDPRRDVGVYLDWANDNGHAIVAVLETHVHADFVSGARELAAATGATVYAGRLGATELPHQPLDDGDLVPIGRMSLAALWTPGHTPEHVSYLLFDPTQSNEPLALFSGDILFAGEIGRPDLLGPEKTGELVDQLYDTVFARLALLPDEVVVYPGHGAGSPCGKKIGDAAQTTIGQEKRFNYAFQARSRADFVRSVMEGMPRPPAYYPTMKRINKNGPALSRDLPLGEPLTAKDVRERQANGALVIDAREPADFAAGHIPDAINVGLGASFAIWAGWLTPYDRAVVLVLPNDAAFEGARTELWRIGIDNVAGYLEGGVAAWSRDEFPAATLEEMPVSTLARRLAKPSDAVQVLDVRDEVEWAAGHVPGAVNVSAGTLATGGDVRFGPEEAVAVICGTGYRSSVAASLLKQRGLRQVITVPGGMEAWTAAGLRTAS